MAQKLSDGFLCCSFQENKFSQVFLCVISFFFRTGEKWHHCQSCHTISRKWRLLYAETDGNIGIALKVQMPRQLISVWVSYQGFFEPWYQSRSVSIQRLNHFCKVMAKILTKESISIICISSPSIQFHGISSGIDADQVWEMLSVSGSSQGPKMYQYQYGLWISSPVCLWFKYGHFLVSCHIFSIVRSLCTIQHRVVIRTSHLSHATTCAKACNAHTSCQQVDIFYV